MNIADPEPGADPRIALFELGFRPFFLLAGIAALLLVSLWLYVYASGRVDFGYYSAVGWHSHEMIFGYTVAVIAGFLLTAVRNWTGIQTPSGKALAGLAALWVAGRLVPLMSQAVPHWVIAVVDTAFVPVLAVALSVPLLRSRQKHNLVFLFVLTALAVANIMVHSQVLGMTQATASRGIYFAVYLVMLLIAILGGRVIPFFTEKGLAGVVTRRWTSIEYLALGSLVLLMLLDLIQAAPAAIIVVATLAALAHGIRLSGWYQNAVWSVPLLWVLHLGYAWIVAGFVLKALAAAGLVNPMLAVHAFTTGGIGIITLGMMARVSLGHTGRPLQTGRAVTWAFVLVNLAATSRVLVPLVFPGHYREWVLLAGVFWSAAFALFVIAYASVLLRPRVDGRPG